MDKATGLFGTVKKGFSHLTKREQVMIYGLVIIVVLAVLIFLVILPALTALSELSDEVAQNQTMEMEMRMTISEADSFAQQYEDSTKNLKTLKKQFFTPMDPESLDETITAIVAKSGFLPKNLQMTTLQQGQIPTYVIQPLASAGMAQTTTSAATENPTQTGDPETGTGTDAYIYTVTVTADGDKSKLSSLLDIVNETSGIELNSYKFSVSADESETGVVTSSGTVNLEFYVYVYVDNKSGITYETMGTDGKDS